MRITDRQLKRIIREERQRIIFDNNQVILHEGLIGDIWQKAKSMVGAGEDEDIGKAVNKVESDLPEMPDIENAKWADVKKIIEAVSGPGTDEKAVKEVIERRANDLPALSKEFEDFVEILKDVRAQIPKTAGDVLKSAAKGAIIGAAILGGLVALASIAVPAGVVSSAAATKGVVGTLVVTGGQSTAAATTAALTMPSMVATGMPAAATATAASKAWAASALGKAMGAKATTSLASGAFMPLAAKMATIGGVAGAKAGAGIAGIDKILGWADTFLNKDTTLSQYLKDDGLDTYAIEIDAKLEDAAFNKPDKVKESKMRITKRQLRRIIREEKKAIVESYNSMSPRSRSIANVAKRRFARDYPGIQVGIDGREGWITVDGKKAVNMSQASGKPLSIEDIVDQMKQAYLGHDMLSQEVPELTGGRKSSWQVRKERELGESKMRITKNQLRRIIKEEKARLLREVETASAADISTADTSSNGDHHWPRVDWSNVGEITDKWIKMEEDAWDKGDTSMNPDDTSDADAKRHWGDQVEGAAMDMEAELTLRVRKIALQTMKEFSDKLLDGQYS